MAEKAALADRIAKQIQGEDAGGNVHIAEERGQQLRGMEGVSEEDRFSNVLGARLGEQGNHSMRAGKNVAASVQPNKSVNDVAAVTVPKVIASPSPGMCSMCSLVR